MAKKILLLGFGCIPLILILMQNNLIMMSDAMLVNGSPNMDEACKDVLTEIIQRQMATLKVCLEEMKFKSGKDKATKMMCVMKCALMKEGFLMEDGNVDLIGSMHFLDKLPPQVKEKAVNLFMECHEHVGKIDPKEEACRTYEPMLKCCQQVINKLCLTDEQPTTSPAPA